MSDALTEDTKQASRLWLSHAAFALVLGVVWERCLWGFWQSGFNALGLNAAVFLLLFTFFALRRREDELFTRHYSKLWCVPLLLIAFSYALYENPFIKACNVLAIPAIFGFVVQRETSLEPARMFRSGFHTLILILYGMCGPLGYIAIGIRSLFKCLFSCAGWFELPTSTRSKSILKGIFYFLLLAVFIVIPLLGSVDPQFAATFKGIYENVVRLLKEIFSEEFVLRVFIILVVALGTLCMRLAWRVEPADVKNDESKQYDSIIAGIVLGGITLLYLLFLYIQLERLFLSTLPSAFAETESYVKQGFWQLIFLSGMNLLFVFTYFRRTVPLVQSILISFTVVSLALLFSAAHRMYLYVTMHGMSYEKFYASYAVLYCFALFSLLLFVLISQTRRVLLRDACALLIWMYAIVCFIPVEQIIIRFNVMQAASSESRIDLADMRMLSLDAYSYVRKNRNFIATLPGRSNGRWGEVDEWLRSKDAQLKKKHWYEDTLASAIARLSENK